MNTPTQDFPMPDYAIALFEAIDRTIGRIYWNRHQEAWDSIQDPGIPGIVWKPFDWNDDSPESSAPNFTFLKARAEFQGLEIRWYKYPGRGMSCNQQWTPDHWCHWYQNCLQHLRAFEASVDHLDRSAKQTVSPDTAHSPV